MTLVQYRNNQPKAFNNFMDDFFTSIPSIMSERFQQSSFKQFPVMNVSETEAGYELEVVAPGFEKEQFTVDVNDKTLTIAAEVKSEKSEKSEKYVRKEYEAKSFKRSFHLDENIDANNICAKYVNGVLTVNLPKRKTVKEGRKQISIS
jgi:HSP20 family protein